MVWKRQYTGSISNSLSKYIKYLNFKNNPVHFTKTKLVALEEAKFKVFQAKIFQF